MMDKKKSSVWQKLDWARKVQICEQGRGNENNLLHNYLVIFIALETILFAATFSIAWGNLWVLIFVFLGVGLAILWAHITELRGNAVDRWEEILAGLWTKADNSETGASELAEHYNTGAVKRREMRGKYGRLAVFKGWGGWRRFLSARWVLTTFVPSLAILGWIAVMGMAIVEVLNC